MSRELPDVGVCLEVAPRDIERKLGAIKYALKHQKVIGKYLFYIVGYEYLIVVELYLTFDRLIFVCDTRKVQDALKVEGIVDIEMEPEQRDLKERENLMVAVLILKKKKKKEILLP